MATRQWEEIDAYIDKTVVAPSDPKLWEALTAALKHSDAEGLAPYHVAPNQGKFLHLLARTCGARRILEIGTLAGYSAIWMASALPEGGCLTSVDSDAKHVEVARANVARAGLGARVSIIHGKALEILPRLGGGKEPPFDMVFIDADKWNSLDYFLQALEMTRPGGLIVVDNAVREGAIADMTNQNPSVAGVRRLYEHLAHEPRVSATALQTVGVKGYDGFILARVNEAA